MIAGIAETLGAIIIGYETNRGEEAAWKNILLFSMLSILIPTLSSASRLIVDMTLAKDALT